MIEIANKQAMLKTIDYLQGIEDDAYIALNSDEFGCLTFEVKVEYNKEIIYCKIAIEALRLQIPEKPIVTIRNYIDENDRIWYDGKDVECPNCRCDLKVIGYHCDDCGKVLDLGDWEE